MFDVIIVGGSNAGLSAALILGRSLRHVLVIDDGKPCNRFSHASHGFLTRDGVHPAELGKIAREQLKPYETVEIKTATAEQITPFTEGFEVRTTDGEIYKAHKIVIATGIKDDMPPLKHIEQFWGTSVFHCPYCDGWEVRDQNFVVYGYDEKVFHHAKMLQHWTPHLTIITDGSIEIHDDALNLYARHNISVVEKAVDHLEGENGKIQNIIFADGSSMPCTTLFIQPINSFRNPFAEALGCEMTEHNRVCVDMLGRTTVPGVYAAGDVTSMMRSVPIAVAQGAAAGYGINADLIEERFV